MNLFIAPKELENDEKWIKSIFGQFFFEINFQFHHFPQKKASANWRFTPSAELDPSRARRATGALLLGKGKFGTSEFFWVPKNGGSVDFFGGKKFIQIPRPSIVWGATGPCGLKPPTHPKLASKDGSLPRSSGRDQQFLPGIRWGDVDP